MKTTYLVDGMTCAGCAGSVARAVMALGPDTKAEVNLEAKTVTIEGCDDEDAIRKAVTDAGYTFGGKV